MLVGVASNCDHPLVRGALNAYDETTGKLVATYYTEPEGSVGGGIWTNAAGDEHGVYVTTGSVDNAHPPAGSQYSIVKLDPKTLAEVARYSIPVTAVGYDEDFGSSPVLFEATLKGARRQMVGACNKNGVFYVVRTDTMELVWTRQVAEANSEGLSACLSGAHWDNRNLFVAGSATTIRGHPYAGSVRALEPATGAVVWETALTANPLSAGTVGPSGVLTYSTFGQDRGSARTNAIYVIDHSDGRVLRRIAAPHNAPSSSEPVWAGSRLLVTTTRSMTAYR